MKKLFFIAVGAFVLAIPTLFGFVYFSAKSSIDCKQFVIDSYELHSGINIPKVKPINCHYDADQNLRISVYQLNGEVDLSRFKQPDNKYTLHGKNLLNADEIPSESASLLIASGTRWNREWSYLIDTESQTLWATLKL